MPLSELKKLMAALDEVASAAKDNRKPDAPIGDTLTHEGITYTVPKDPSDALTFGQYVDLEARLEKVEQQDAALATVLAVVLTEEGKGYDASGIEARERSFLSLPAMTAIRHAAFFFAGCSDLAEVWSRYMSRRLASRLQALQQEVSALASVTGGSSPSPEQPS
jgi:hypothetical protein